MSQLNDEENNINNEIEPNEEIKIPEEVKEEVVNEEEKINNKNKIKKEKKKLTTRKKVIIFLFIFLIVAISLTAGAIYYTNKNQDKNIIGEIINKIEKAQDNVIGIQALTEKYNQNDLKIVDKEFKEGEFIQENQWYSYYKVEIYYDQIEGLKDKTIEEQINKEIKDKVLSMYTNEELNDNNIKKIHISANCTANYANVLSISIYKSTDLNSKDINYPYGYKYESSGLNYDLKTGKQIEFKDLFTANTGIKNIITEAAYENLAFQYSSSQESYEPNMEKIDYSEIENDIFLMLNEYNSGNFTFSFTENYIFLEIGEKSISIEMSVYYQNIAIYNRYKDNNDIYDGTYTGGKDLFVFMYSDSSEEFYYKVFEEVTDNLFVDATIYVDETDLKNSVIKTLVEQYESDVKKQIESYKQELKNQTNKAIVYEVFIQVYKNQTENSVNINQSSGEYKMSKAYYNSDFYTHIAKSNTSSFEGGYGGVKYFIHPQDETEIITKQEEQIENGSSYYLETKNLKEKQEYTYNKYDLETGELIVPDITAPEITLNGSENVKINLNENYIEQGAIAIDDKDGNITDKIFITGFVDNTKAGTYTITYNVEDLSNNVSTAIRTVTVEEISINNINIIEIDPNDISINGL